MKFDRQSSCAECPFRKNAIKGYIGPYTTTLELLQTAKERPFACHKSPGNGNPEHSDAQACFGAAVMARKSAAVSRNPEVRAYQDEVGKQCLSNPTSEQLEIMDQWETLEYHKR